MKATKANVTKVLKAAKLHQHKFGSPNAYSSVGFLSVELDDSIRVEWLNTHSLAPYNREADEEKLTLIADILSNAGFCTRQVVGAVDVVKAVA